MLAESGQTMTTNRTPIRRRLAVGRTTHAPPWGRRKAGHRSIVPPLAATIAATLALRAGVALARAAREGRATGRRKAWRRIGVDPQETLGTGMRRMALGQLDLTIEMVERIGEGGSPERSVHEARKALKRLRALMRLLEPELGEQVRERENDVLRAAGEALSAARDADVLLSTLDRLVEANPDKLAGRSGVMRLRAHLRDRRDRAWQAMLGDAAGRALTLSELRAARARVAAWQLPEGAGVELVQPGLVRVYRQGREPPGPGRARAQRAHARLSPLAQTREGASLRGRNAAVAGGRRREAPRQAGTPPPGAGTQAGRLAAAGGTARGPARRTARGGARSGGAGGVRARSRRARAASPRADRARHPAQAREADRCT